jgi:hypothetical protein
MKSKLQRAVEQTAKRWCNNAFRRDGGTDDGDFYCGFCKQYRAEKVSVDDCVGCPVYKLEHCWCDEPGTGLRAAMTSDDPVDALAIAVYAWGFLYNGELVP